MLRKSVVIDPDSHNFLKGGLDAKISRGAESANGKAREPTWVGGLVAESSRGAESANGKARDPALEGGPVAKSSRVAESDHGKAREPAVEGGFSGQGSALALARAQLLARPEACTLAVLELGSGRRRTRQSRDERICREGMHQARVRHQMAVRIPQLDVLLMQYDVFGSGQARGVRSLWLARNCLRVLKLVHLPCLSSARRGLARIGKFLARVQ